MNLRQLPTVALLVACLAAPALAQQAQDVFARETILAQMRKVADWQLANMPAVFKYPDGRTVKMSNTDWIRAALFTGIMAAYNSTGDEKYLDAMIKIGQGNGWKPGPRPRHADDHCIGQTYAEIYLLKKDPQMIAAMIQTFDRLIAEPQNGAADWWWCDALYMAPPAMARLSAATGDRKYLDLMDRMWWECTDFLFDKEEHLYFRDKNYFIHPDGTGKREKNGKKIFWSRGNGWVMAGTARVLQYMPQDYPSRARYIALFKEMAAKIAAIQQPDGLWRVSLLDPETYPGGETSGSGFYTFAIAWGINNGILDRETYLPVIRKSWPALNACVAESGRLGWAQPVGAAPVNGVTAEHTMDYGAGAYLLAASEMAKLK